MKRAHGAGLAYVLLPRSAQGFAAQTPDHCTDSDIGAMCEGDAERRSMTPEMRAVPARICHKRKLSPESSAVALSGSVAPCAGVHMI